MVYVIFRLALFFGKELCSMAGAWASFGLFRRCLLCPPGRHPLCLDALAFSAVDGCVLDAGCWMLAGLLGPCWLITRLVLILVVWSGQLLGFGYPLMPQNFASLIFGLWLILGKSFLFPVAAGDCVVDEQVPGCVDARKQYFFGFQKVNVSFPRFVGFCVKFLSQFGCLEAKVLPAVRDSALASLGANAFQELIGVAPEICVHRVDQDSLVSFEQWIAEIAWNHQVA